jgi:FimV-like protein
MAHIFISYSTKDGGEKAGLLVAALETAALTCWIAPRNMKPGTPYPGQVVRAVRESRALVLLLTPAANESPDILGEVNNAQNERKLIVPVIVHGTRPSDELIYFLAARQQLVWTEAKTVATALEKVFKQGPDAASMNEVDTKLELARAWIDSGDAHGALQILADVVQDGSALQKQEAQHLIEMLPL